MLTQAKSLIRRLLEQQGYTIKRVGLGYIAADATLSAAQQANLPVGDYVEQLWNKVGEAQRVVTRIMNHGIPTQAANIVEIGPGTGRYLAKVLEHGQPNRYEIYETDPGWTKWLQATYPVIRQPADGISLTPTASESADLVHAHGVFVYLPFLTTWRYWQELWRVTRPGGMVAFDIFSENCFSAADMERWLSSGETYPCFLSTAYVTDVFAQHNFQLVDQFLSPCCEGHSEYLIFRRNN